jgi:folate-binding protein YgfZ
MKNVIHLPEFGFLAITGRDALKFLQGYSTCDLATVTPGSPGIGATCNIQGRMLANYRIAAIEAELIDESTSYHCYGHTGAFDVPEGALMVAIDTAGERQECWSTQSPSITPDQTQLNAWHQAELAAGLVWLDITSVEEYIPQMLNLQNFDGISFKKGCYLGQEIVARMQYRGQLKRKLHRGQATHQVKPGDLIISATGSTLGKIVASVGQEFLAVTSIAGTDTTFQLSSGEKLALSPVS